MSTLSALLDKGFYRTPTMYISHATSLSAFYLSSRKPKIAKRARDIYVIGRNNIDRMKIIERQSLIVLSLIFLTSCSHYFINKEGYYRPPKNYRFSYKKNSAKLTNNEVIDTTVVYYLHNSNYYRNSSEYKNVDHYIRFYSDGRFKLQGTKETPKTEDVNDINKGIIGYYKLKGRVIKLQIYGDINGGSDQLEFGLIDDNGDLILLNENPRTDFCIGYSEDGIKRKIAKSSFFNPKRYEKLKIDGMTYETPNW